MTLIILYDSMFYYSIEDKIIWLRQQVKHSCYCFTFHVKNWPTMFQRGLMHSYQEDKSRRLTRRSFTFKNTLNKSDATVIIHRGYKHSQAATWCRQCFAIKFSDRGAESTIITKAIHPVISPGCITNESTLNRECCVWHMEGWLTVSQD